MENEKEIKELIYKFGERALQDYQKETTASLSPQRCDNYLSMLSGYSALLEEELGTLEINKAKIWLEFREDYKSNVDADMAFDATEEGLRTLRLKRTLKGVDKVIAACKARLRRLESERYNS